MPVAYKKLEENEHCEGILPSGVRCVRKARLGDPPRWCWNCEPGPEADARRRQAGAKRHPPGTHAAKVRDEARKEGTLDEIVRDALKTSQKLTEQARAAASKDSLSSARLGNAAAALHRAAISALKARSTVGDILPKAKVAAKAPEEAEGATAAQDGGALESWLPGRVDA